MAIMELPTRCFSASVGKMAAGRGTILHRQGGGPGQEVPPSPKSSAEAYPPPAEAKAISPAFFAAIAHIQAQAQAYLNNAITCERGRQWLQAIDYYRKLLHCLNRKKFPSEYVPGPGYAQLIFESYYHTGVAFQKVNSHREAFEEFTYAMEETNIPKTGCKVGCATSTFYHTPVFARRAYAYVKCDKIKEAINDATRAVYSDPSNPDVYCIRALVWSSAKEKSRALHDLNVSFRLNSSHVCTLILRGAILKSIGGIPSLEPNKDQEKAFKLCPESANFFDVEDFHSPKMPYFYDKFLRSLNAFHTITEINLFAGATFVTTLDTNKGPRIPTPLKPFRHGYEDDSNNFSLLRRKAYIQACMESGIIINGSRHGSVKKGSGPSVVQEPVKKGSRPSIVQESVKKESRSSVVWESGCCSEKFYQKTFGNPSTVHSEHCEKILRSEDLKTCEVTVAKKKKGGSSTVNWNL